ncbi:MAG: sialidase family protein, partial [Bacteroidota bacterium]
MRLTLLLLIIPMLTFGQTQVDLPGLKWRNVGPANQGGRIVDIEALNGQFRKVWMATGSGGVWYSENAGTTWTPIFDNYSTASIGDIAVYQQDPSIIWVGTGEANNRNSVSWGDGVFKSTDGGKTFENVGLRSTHQIARVVTLPNQPESVCVCAVGHLWGTTGERGLFKTKDGGENWEKLTNGLPNDGKTGCTDLVVDPNNSNVMYAAFYERLRKPWIFKSGGANGGIFKTVDGGKSWTKLMDGLPQGPTGRIGLAIYKKNPEILMALVEAEQTNDLAKPGSGLYRSENGGASWTYVNTYNNRPFYYSQVRINPHDDQRVYLLTTRFMVSDDGGENLRDGSQDQEVHGDFHAMWLDPNDADRYYLGADKGMSITHDHGNKFQLFDNLPIAQFYRIGLDHQDPFMIYGGLQDNGFYATASFTRDTRGVLNDSNWKVHWGDGQYTAIDPDDPRTVYTSAENGSLNLYDPITHRLKRINPHLRNISNYDDYYDRSVNKPGGYLRFNWSSPFKMAESKNIYYAGNHVFKSTNQGKSWEIISPDLSSNDS